MTDHIQGCRKQSGYDVTKGLKVTMGWNVAIFMGKMDVKYIRLKYSYGQNVTVWEEGNHETSGKNVTELMFCHNPV